MSGRVIAVAIVASIAVTGCKDKKPAEPAEGSGRSAKVTPPPRPPGMGSGSAVRRPGPPAGVMTDLTLEEATPILPTIAGTTVIDPPKASPQGEQVHLAWCITAKTQPDAREVLRAGLTAAEWGEIHDSGQVPRLAIFADKAPYRLTASISQSAGASCSPSDGHWFASVSIFKIANTRPTQTPGTPPPGSPPGTPPPPGTTTITTPPPVPPAPGATTTATPPAKPATTAKTTTKPKSHHH